MQICRQLERAYFKKRSRCRTASWDSECASKECAWKESASKEWDSDHPPPLHGSRLIIHWLFIDYSLIIYWLFINYCLSLAERIGSTRAPSLLLALSHLRSVSLAVTTHCLSHMCVCMGVWAVAAKVGHCKFNNSSEFCKFSEFCWIFRILLWAHICMCLDWSRGPYIREEHIRMDEWDHTSCQLRCGLTLQEPKCVWLDHRDPTCVCTYTYTYTRAHICTPTHTTYTRTHTHTPTHKCRWWTAGARKISNLKGKDAPYYFPISMVGLKLITSYRLMYKFLFIYT